MGRLAQGKSCYIRTITSLLGPINILILILNVYILSKILIFDSPLWMHSLVYFKRKKNDTNMDGSRVHCYIYFIPVWCASFGGWLKAPENSCVF